MTDRNGGEARSTVQERAIGTFLALRRVCIGRCSSRVYEHSSTGGRRERMRCGSAAGRRPPPHEGAPNWPHSNRVHLATITLLATIIVGVQPARAGTYVMRNCNVPGHAPAAVGPWQQSMAQNLVFSDACSTGGGFGFAMPGIRAMEYRTRASLILLRPTDSDRAVVEFRRVRLWVVARLSGTGNGLYATVIKNYNSASTIADRGDVDMSTAPHDSGAIGGDINRYELTLGCAGIYTAPAGRACDANDELPLQIRGAEVTLSENVLPHASVVGGTLFGADIATGAEDLRYSASDRESGIAKIEALLGGTVVGVRDLGTKCGRADFTVCPLLDEGELAIDTTRVADGWYPLTLRVADAAGNQREVQHRVVQVKNREKVVGESAVGGPPSGVPSSGEGGPSGDAPSMAPLAFGQDASITANFAGSTSSVLTVPFARRVTINGHVATASGRPLGNAQIDIVASSKGADSRETVSASVRSQADGSFSHAVAGRRPSRELRVVYRSISGALAMSRVLKLRVRTASTLQVVLRGATVNFKGRVLGGHLPRRGKRVQLQGRAPGYQWATFRRIRTDSRGRFSGTYRLPVRRPGVRLQIRALVPGERDYPYQRFQGRPLSLRVQ